MEPGREPGVEHMKGDYGIWKSARDIILMVLLSYVRRRHSTGPTGHSVIDPPPLLLSTLSLPRPVPDSRLLLTHFPPPPCLEVNPPNIVHPLTSNPQSHSIIITTIIIINNNNNNNNNNKSNYRPPLTLPPPLILVTLFHAPNLTRPDQTWISSQILSSSPLLPPLSTHLLFALPLALLSAEIQPFPWFLVSPSRTAALPVVHPAHPPLRQAALVMAALPHKSSRSYHLSSPLLLLPTSTNGVFLRPPSPTL